MSEEMATADDESADVPSPPPPRGRGKIQPITRTDRVDAETQSRSLSDWMRGLGVGGASGQFQVKVTRLEPSTHGGKRVGGFLKSYSNEFIDEALIQEQHGGGKFQIQVFRMDERGSFVYHKAKNVDVAGDPRPLASDDPVKPAQPDTGGALAAQAMQTMMGIVADTKREAGRAPDSVAVASLIASAVAPLERTIEMLRNDLQAARQAATQVQVDPVRDGILKKVMEDDSARTSSIRVAHQSELNQLRQSMADIESRLRDQHQRDLDRIERDHDRSMQDTVRQYEGQINNLKHAYEGQIATLKESQSREISSMTLLGTTRDSLGQGEIQRLERENNQLRAEVVALREKKDKSIFEQAKELEEIRDLLGGGDDDDKKAGWEKVLNTPAATAVLAKIAGLVAPDGTVPGQPGQLQPQQPQPQLQAPPPFTPFQGGDGRWYTHDGQGNIRPYVRPEQRRKRPRQAAPAPMPPAAEAPVEATVEMTPEEAAQAQAQAEAARAAQVAQAQAAALAQAQAQALAQAASELDRGMVQAAIDYLEGGYRRGTEPQIMAQSLRSQGLVPTSIFQFLREQGVDPLLDKVARLEASSPLATQKGRNWVRSVAKSLVEG